MRINTLLNEEGHPEGSPSTTTPVPVKKGPGRGNWRRHKKTDASPATGRSASGEGSHHVPLLPNNGSMFVNENPATPGSNYTTSFATANSPQRLAFQPPTTGDHVPTPSYQAQKRSRGVTQHQNALINHRRQQIDYTLDRRIRRLHVRARSARESEGAFFRAWRRVKAMPPDYDSEEETIRARKARDRTEGKDDEWRRGGAGSEEQARALLAGFVRVEGEAADLGEEARALARALRRAGRRLDRWQEAALPGQAVVRRREREAGGLLYAAREEEVEGDGVEEEETAAPAIVVNKRRGPKGPRKSAGGKGKGKAAAAAAAAVVEDVNMEDEVGEDEGGGELDEEDREMLGEVDADADESEEDEDETMADE